MCLCIVLIGYNWGDFQSYTFIHFKVLTNMTRRRVVLHFDLNRTILMSDAAGGRSMENTVNYLLSECTWGYVNPSRPSEWICVSKACTINPPELKSNKNHLITYKQFVDDAHPYQSIGSLANSDVDQIQATNRIVKKQRTALQSAFTSGKDAPGSPVHDSFIKVMQNLYFPIGKQRETAQELAATMPASCLQEAWSAGRYYLLPSFLHFLSFLTSPQVHEKKLDVKLVFRTFGNDLVDVANELELLVDGHHPMGFPALPERFRLKLEPKAQCVGTFYRDGFDAAGTALAVGTLVKVPFPTTFNEESEDVPLHFYAALKNSEVKVVRGFQSIQQTIEGMLQNASTVALRDYWEWWSAHAEDHRYGKLLLIDDKQKDDIVVFFDDHIESHDAHIVDVRDVESGVPIDFVKSRGKFLERVEPFAAITDTNYFVALFNKHVD